MEVDRKELMLSNPDGTSVREDPESIRLAADCNQRQVGSGPVRSDMLIRADSGPHVSFRKCCACIGITQPASKIKLFGEISSIRGVQRIFRAETPFIRTLWILFVISMTCLLTVSSFMLIVDYLQYTTSWHTRSLPDDKSEFPAITLCAHNPFSLKANKLWSTGHVISPNQVKSNMAAVSLEMLNQDKVEDSVIMALSDSFEFYYTNLSPEDSQKISHDFEIIPHCILYSPEHTVVAEKCEMENVTAMVRRTFSHPKYFNCLTIEGGGNESTSDISRLVLLAHLVPSSKIVQARSAFIMDTFTRGEGIKVVIHERNTYPQIERYGFNVQPNRMNEIIYETLSWKRLSTPVAPCKDSQPPISDLGVNYTYETSQCLDIATQEEMIRRCGCMNSEWPRPTRAVHGPRLVPYCTSMDRNSSVEVTATVLSERLACSRIFFEELPVIRERIIRAGICIPRCRFFTYDTKLSVTSWEPSPVKLSSYTANYRIVEEYLTEPIESKKKELSSFLQSIIDPTLDSADEQWNKRIGDYKQFGDGTYTYISLIRRDFDTTLKEEKLVFDAPILLSRIGGLCSLCIGLTMAFFIEIIEFIYAVFHSNNNNNTTNENDDNNNHTMTHVNELETVSSGKTAHVT
ncbi:FMRFamide-activated amiloride-sensitive sodium channel [Fasciola hepatica]|uniref:FMRFamide-activated amiloride-sensitive sodium channel n=1 Tax=Fasciola hepatica TaxID=6192 RepID=A0A4E0RFC3_FASHE|nr:FMRFamide-activated amiloride-sensitive sodium channel [Fasciola hepatica]